jgi:hypothetical protein
LTLANENSNLTPDEAWLLLQIRRVKDEGFGTLEVVILAGHVDRITVRQTHKRMSGIHVKLSD